jgi:hypothetical protein
MKTAQELLNITFQSEEQLNEATLNRLETEMLKPQKKKNKKLLKEAIDLEKYEYFLNEKYIKSLKTLTN